MNFVRSARWNRAPEKSPFCSLDPLSRAVLKNLLPAFVGAMFKTENGRSFLLTAGQGLHHPVSRSPLKQVAILNDLRAPSAKRTAAPGGVKMNRWAFWWTRFGPQKLLQGNKAVRRAPTWERRHKNSTADFWLAPQDDKCSPPISTLDSARSNDPARCGTSSLSLHLAS